jgi:outer membrane lipase/esterase
MKRAMLAGAVALIVAAPATAQFTNVYFFGDSLSDGGQYKPLLPPGTGLFTTNPGPVWPTVFAGDLGFAAIPSTQGGTDYAYGGARVTSLPGVLPPPLSPSLATPIATQVQQFLAKGPLDPNAIYSIQGGGNDFFYQFGLLLAGQSTPAQLQAALGTAAVQLGQQVAILQANGARYVMIWNLPDIGLSPDAKATGQAATVTQLAAFFNSTLQGTLNAIGGQQIRLDSFRLFRELIANPGFYGIQNATGVACTTPVAYLCTPATLVAANAPQTYLFSDGSHPTTLGHQIIADYAISFIVGPAQIAALGEAPFAVEEANFRALDGRMWSSLNTNRGQHKLEAWAAYDYGSIDMNAGLDNGTAHQNTVAVGGDMKISNNLLVGAMFGYSENKGDFGGPGGGYKLRQPVGTLYAGYGDGPLYFGATVGAGSLDYTEITRNIPLGAGVRTETGQSKGNEYTGRLLAGYWFSWDNLLHGPYARVSYTKNTVRQYAETGSDSTALIFGEQKVEQLLWSVGWQVAGNWGGIRPFARATWEYDSLDRDRSVMASSVNLGGWYSIPVAKPDNNYVLFNLGASADLGGITGYVTGSATAAKGDGNYYAITVGIRAPL